MLLADRGYDADWIRELAMKKGAWANIPPKSNRIDSIFSPRLYGAATGPSGSSTGSNNAVGLQRATTNWQRTTSFSLPRSSHGFVLMSPVLELPVSFVRGKAA